MNKRQFLLSSLTAAAAAAGCSTRNETSQMVKMVFLLHRRPGMDFNDFSQYWRDKHAAIGAALPGVRKYVQNHAVATLDGSPLPYDGIAELWFDDMEALQSALASPEAQAAIADSKNFVDVQHLQSVIVKEVVVI